MDIMMPETYWANSKFCNKKTNLLHLVGLLFPRINDDARSNSHQVSEFIYVMRLDTEQFWYFLCGHLYTIVLTSSRAHTIVVHKMGCPPVSWRRSLRRWRNNNRSRILAEICKLPTFEPDSILFVGFM